VPHRAGIWFYGDDASSVAAAKSERRGALTSDLQDKSFTINAIMPTSATPLPAAVPLFASGIGGFGLFGAEQTQGAVRRGLTTAGAISIVGKIQAPPILSGARRFLFQM
jgi:hypothetical protein